MNNKRHGLEDGEDFSDAPLTPEENRRIRRMVRDQERARWFWSTARIWVAYFTAFIIGVGLAASHLRDGMKWFVK